MRAWSLLRIWSIVVLAAVSTPAWAVGDCPLIGTLENFDATHPPQIIAYDSEDFRVVEGNEAKTVSKEGKVCKQQYVLRSGLPSLSALEIMQNYAEALPGEGFRITNTDRSKDGDIVATVTKGGVEYWVRVWQGNGNVIADLVLQVQPFKPSLSPASDKDCPIVRGLENFTAPGPPQITNYSAEDFRVTEGRESTNVRKMGRVCRQQYALPSGVPSLSALDIMQNYAVALPAAGLRITNTERRPSDDIFATMTKDGVESWVHVWQGNGNVVAMLVLQIEPFKPSLSASSDKDCPLMRGIEKFVALNPPQITTYNAESFRVVEGTEAKNVTKMGRLCRQQYALPSGLPSLSALEIMQNYAEGLPQAGFRITNTDRNPDGDVFATITKDGAEYWVHVWQGNGNAVVTVVLQVQPFKSSLLPAGDKDCPLLQRMDRFVVLNPPQFVNFEAQEFRVVDNGTAQNVSKSGKVCRQRYDLPPGTPNLSALEIMQNYAEGLPAAGLTITNTDRDPAGDVFATMTKDGVESWVHVWQGNGNVIGTLVLQIQPFKSSMKAPQVVDEPPPPPPPPAPVALPPPPKPIAAYLAFAAPAATPEPVDPAQGDFPYLPPMPGSRFVGGHADPAPFYVQPSDAKQPELVANGSIVKEYQPPAGVGLAQLLGAYHTALLKARWSIVSEFHSAGVQMSAHYGENGRNIWATLHLADAGYSIAVADATIRQNQLAADLGSKCHLALTGVLFDFNKSTLKPESNAVLDQVSAMMRADPALKLEIQGHTDNVGTDAYNQPLSEARARSVVIWLTQHQVPLSRLSPRGYGKTRPIADNGTDEGRAQNRRVEIANPACQR
jgi:outer membrane protein OmpA-like peptidoglycan-associated protein